jgi:hypothetical protein
MIEALAAAVLLGGINTIADFVSAELKLEARPIYVLARVVLICYCVGGIVGARARQLLMGTAGGLMIGALVSAVFYLVAQTPLAWTALVLAWSVFWLGFSLLDTVLQGGSAVGALLQGLAAALLSGAFYYGIGNIWPQNPSLDPNLWRLLTWWSAAFLPGSSFSSGGGRNGLKLPAPRFQLPCLSLPERRAPSPERS